MSGMGRRSNKRDDEQQGYSSWGRPFRLQLSAEAASGFQGVASRGRCQYPDCRLFEWSQGAAFCRDHWLLVHQQTRLPERWGVE